MADDKLRGKVHRVIVCPANDDMFELDPLLHQQGHVVETNDQDALDLEGFQMISLGWTNPTPWNTFRELPENELAKRVDELVAKVTDPSRTIFNFHAPPYRSGLDEAPTLVVSALYAYTSEFKTFVLDAVLVIAVTFFGTLIAGMILPWRKRELFENSVVGRYRIAGVPVIAITSGLAAIFLGWNIYQWLTNSTYGVNNRTSLIFMGAMYALAIVIYVIAKLVRRRQGINLKVVYGEIPAE